MTDRELWTIDQAAEHLGVKPSSARGTLSRWGVAAIEHRQIPGGRVKAYYDAAEVREAYANRPGRGARTDRKTA